MRDFIQVRQPFEAVAPRLIRNPAWLDPIARGALEEAVATLDALRPDQPLHGDRSPVTVRCTRGPVRLRSDTLVMPLSWKTNLASLLLPNLDGDLEVVPLGADRSQIVLSANTAGSSRDGDATSCRVVESGLRAFLRQLATRLELAS